MRKFLNIVKNLASALQSFSNMLNRFCHNKERSLYGYTIKCPKCHKKFNVLLADVTEDEYEEPYGGFSTYLVTECPHCNNWVEPDKTIYELYYKK